MSQRSIWATLGIKASADRDEIRRAYSRKLKITNPEDDAEGFQALRAAYERALALADQRARAESIRLAEQADALTPELATTDEGSGSAEIDRDLAAEPTRAEAPDPAVDALRLAKEVHQAACEHLAALLSGSEPASDAVLLAALDEVIKAPAMEAMHVHDWVEGYVAWLIVNNGPRSDILINSAIGFFGWDHNRIGPREAMAEIVVARAQLLHKFALLARPGHEQHSAFEALKRPPRGLHLWLMRLHVGLPAKVRTLLDGLRREDESLVARLNPQAVAWWDERLSRPHFAAVSIWLLIAAPVAFLPLVTAPPVYVGWVVASWTAIVAWHFGIVLQRYRWLINSEGAALVPRLGWGALTIVSVAIAAFAPPSLIATVTAAVLALAAAAWAAITGERDTADEDGPPWALANWVSLITIGLLIVQPLLIPFTRIPWRLRALTAFGYLAVFVLLAQGEIGGAAFPQLTLPLIGMAAAFAAGSSSLVEAWRDLTVGARRALLLGLGAAIGATPVLLWAAAPGRALVPAAVGLISMLVLLQKIPGATLSGRFRLIRDVAVRYGWFVWLFAFGVLSPYSTQGDAVLLYGGLWLLTGAAITVVGALRMEPAVRRAPVSGPVPA